MRFRHLFILSVFCCVLPVPAQIPEATDAPRPLPPAESVKRIKLPPGYRLELIAAEPLVREPSGVCWDEKGRLFVCELHGYNLEGQYDIDELNKTGKLDTQVRRIQASPEAHKKAKEGIYGTVKMLVDSKGDGHYDKAIVYADRLPPCYGICPARGGVIVACAPDIVYLADTKGDGKADVREVLFTGFGTGPLERGINCPQWGPDNWIYMGHGRGGAITGPRLKKTVQLPNTDFRIKPDGSAIEPVGGRTHTIGSTFTDMGERFVGSTGSPGNYVPPLPWYYLGRNPYIASPGLEINVSPGGRVYPISEPHPWRKKRAEIPGYVKFYGTAETTPNGNFTSACSPFVYLDPTLAELRGQLLACEPAQNMIHRSIIERDGLVLRLRRAPGEEKSEFLASSDIWFHPIALTHAPDGTIWIMDFYREIIEDYSAVPRHLQQIYGVVNGKDHGRVWKLTHKDALAGPPTDMSRLKVDELAKEVVGEHYWRRQTARRLLIERGEKAAAPTVAKLLREAKESLAAINAIYTLDGLGELQAADALAALAHERPAVRVHGLRLAERWFGDHPELLAKALALTADADPAVLLQAALSVGESQDARVLPALARLARENGDQRWLANAILSSLSGKGAPMLAELLQSPAKIGKARILLEPLCSGIGARANGKELSEALVLTAAVEDKGLRVACLTGLRATLKTPTTIAVEDAGRAALMKLAGSMDAETRSAAEALVIAIRIEDPAKRKARLDQATREVADIKLAVETRLIAVAQLAAEDDAASTATLLAAFAGNTPKVREAILGAVISRRERLPALVDALEKKTIAPSALSAVQRLALLENQDAVLRQRAAKFLKRAGGANDETFRRFAAALANKRDLAQGEKVFSERCATCHQAHGVGLAVGPDLNSEFQRAEETILTDILTPSAAISPGFATYTVETSTGLVASGILASESANSVTLRMAEGKEQTILRKDIERLFALTVSLMPEDLVKVLSPQDVADVIAFVRSPPNRVVLLDDDPALAAALNEGPGTATFVTSDKFSGQAALRVTPLQRSAARIKGWDFRIRENPAAGEFRYVRFAWKADGAKGVLIEFANNGQWPDAKSPSFRYVAGKNTSGWHATVVAPQAPGGWTVVTRDLWKDFGDSTITGIAPTAMEGPALFDRIELLRTVDKSAK